jgi:hypothetical protein
MNSDLSKPYADNLLAFPVMDEQNRVPAVNSGFFIRPAVQSPSPRLRAQQKRIQEILAILRDGLPHKPIYIASQMGVTQRTIYRDFDLMRDEMRLPLRRNHFGFWLSSHK